MLVKRCLVIVARAVYVWFVAQAEAQGEHIRQKDVYRGLNSMSRRVVQQYVNEKIKHTEKRKSASF